MKTTTTAGAIRNAAIYDVRTGDVITEGLQTCRVCDEALNMARRIAAERGEPVLLVDADGHWHVQPDGDCEEVTVAAEGDSL